MTKPINIYNFSRIPSDNKEELAIIYHHSSQCKKLLQSHEIKSHEIESLKLLTDKLLANHVTIKEMDGFFYSFRIPHFDKEFDLLKFTEESCLNIELKSQSVDKDKILEQLVQNRHYLESLGKRLQQYSVVTDTDKIICYQLSSDNELNRVEFDDIVRSVKDISDNYSDTIDDLFCASKYLASPLNEPERFMQGKYFLTNQQEDFKKEIIKAADRNNFFYLTGNPGTGKTLLLYDLAKKFSKKGKTLIIHCGIFAPKQNEIKIEQLKIIEVKELKNNFSLAEYKYILIDETQRIYKKQFKKICQSVKNNNQVCIFSADPQQTLSKKEKKSKIVEEIKEIVHENIYHLNNTIRTNKELSSFINCMRNLNQAECLPDYSGVQVEYADSEDEALSMIKYYREKGYVFINYPMSKKDPHSQFFKQQLGKDEKYEVGEIHEVIGQEFDNVVIFMDEYFSYKEGKLCADPNLDWNYLYDSLFYQAVTRAREKLTIIVLDNMKLFRNIVSVLNPTKKQDKING